ncbi:DUF2334 domain-containing protein [Saccharopolyspora rosea]|uniref:DUF2334 domain-containing protein n=1 Tax=Saccharopolyspora rosea TaxID=524884 RepID=A0ABW3FMN9_9PSEU|nr:DUF2334 domain-containing protein [Saccharopolyspora rosea]
MPLVVSLAGFDARTLDRCADFAAELDRRGVPLTLLLPPGPRPAPPVRRWLSDRLTAGDALGLRGFGHCSGRLLPAALPAHEAGLRLVAARAALERMDLSTDTFVLPRRLASPGTTAALRRHGFAVCADASTVRDLVTGRLHRARARSIGPGERGEPWRCRALVLGAGRAARRRRMVRLAVRAGDLARPGPRQAVLDGVDLALHHGADPITYSALAAARDLGRCG